MSHEPIQYSLNTGLAQRFGIHHHLATRDHYDLRLEMGACAHSWVLPKGISTDPREWREMIRVDDHKLKCLFGEGRIPAGNYGAGPMIMWDWGTYGPVGDIVNSFEQTIEEGLGKGHLKLRFDGVKLCGDWEMKLRKGSWHIRKLPDEYASETDILLLDWSVITGRKIEEV